MELALLRVKLCIGSIYQPGMILDLVICLSGQLLFLNGVAGRVDLATLVFSLGWEWQSNHLEDGLLYCSNIIFIFAAMNTTLTITLIKLI